ncbi:MAG: hypothetical protein Q7S66_05060 [bacterium]|nr:hypothetical protein [bacterium]
MKWNIFEKPRIESSPPPPIPKDELVPDLSQDIKNEPNISVQETAKENTEFNDPNIDFTFESPKIDSYTRINYAIPDYEGRELRPERRLLFRIPEEFKNRIIRDIILRHRKSSKYAVNIGSDGYDPSGAYSRVELHNIDNGQWTGWRDPAGYRTDKFAEPRSAENPEEEVLHDWIATVGPISADAVRVTNVGSNPDLSISNIHGLEIVFYPEFKSIDFKEKIYTLGTKFVDLEKGDLLPAYGAGEFNEGKYVGAIALNRSEPVLFELGKNLGTEARIENDRLVIKLDQGKELLNIEVAIGDTEHLNSRNPETHRNIRLGWAKLWMGIRRAKTGNVEWFVKNANIPPQGVIAGGPHLENSKIEPGDELILESRADASYVMGWRLAYK